MKLRCKTNAYMVLIKSDGIFGKNIEESRLIGNLTIGKIYEVIYSPETDSEYASLIFYNDQKTWQEICYKDLEGDIEITCNCEVEDSDTECTCEELTNLSMLKFFEPME